MKSMHVDPSQSEPISEIEHYKTKVQTLNKKISELMETLATLKQQCPHHTERIVLGLNSRTGKNVWTYKHYVVMRNRSDSGNWCKSDDQSWTNCKCGLCGSSWDVEPQIPLNENYDEEGKWKSS